MLKSMTAYGRALIHNAIGRFTAEIHSVNKRHLEISLQIPREILRFEVSLKKWIATIVGRGQIYLKITIEYDQILPLKAKPNLPLVRELKAAWEMIAKEAGFPLEAKDFAHFLTEQNELIAFEENVQDETLMGETLHNLVNMALEKLVEMQIQEGRLLIKDFNQRLDKVKLDLDHIAILAPHASEKYRQKLMKRIEDLTPGYADNESYVLRDVGLFAEKVDITEEVVRLNAHLSQFNTLLEAQDGIVGKKMDFLLQEMLREANTICNKTSELEVIQHSLEIKSELDRMREQIQNIV